MKHDRGSATAELAVALPAVILLLVVGVTAVAAVTAKLGCLATARDAALAAARGDPPSTTEGVTVEQVGGRVTVTVRRALVVCTAVAAAEPGSP